MVIWFFAAIGCVRRARFWRLKSAAPMQWPLDANRCGLLVAGGLLLSSTVGALTLRAMGAEAGDPPAAALLAALVAGSLTTVAIFLALRPRGASPRTTHAAPPCRASRAVLTGIGGLLVAWPLIQVASLVGGALQFRFTGAETPAIGHRFLETIGHHASDPNTWGLIAAVTLLGPLAEELVWRGGVQQGLKQIGLPRSAAILVTATAFALIHWSAVPEGGRASAIPALAVLGAALGWLMERSGRLWASFTAHALFNCANLFLFSMLPQ
jgi:membrane protease YdiL (CAAX protease family)